MTKWLSRTIAMVALGALALSTASAAPAPLHGDTAAGIRKSFNEQMKTCGDARMQKVAFSSETKSVPPDGTWTLGNGKLARATTDMALFTMGGKLDADGYATSMIFTARPQFASYASSATYRRDWTIAGVCALQSFLNLRGVDAQQAKAMLGTDLGMPIDFTYLSDGLAATRVERMDLSAEKTYALDGMNVTLSASIQEDGRFELRASYIGDAEPTGDAIALTENGTTKLKVGQTYSVRLTANAGTGYEWTYAFTEGASRSAFLAKAPIQAENRPGGPVTFEWRFTAQEAGKQVLVFSLARSWESVQPSKTATYTIEIEK